MRNENALRVGSDLLFHRPASGKYTSDFSFVNSVLSDQKRGNLNGKENAEEKSR